MKSPDKYRRLTSLVCALAFVFRPVVFAGSGTGVSNAHNQTSAQGLTQLSKDSTPQREISEGETHIYGIHLEAGEFLRVTVEGPGADLILSLNNAEGRTVAEVSAVIGFLPKKRLSFLSSDKGDYRLALRCARKGPPRSYLLKVTDSRRGELKDQSSISGERAYDEAVRLEFQSGAEDTLRAIAKYEDATKHFHDAGDRPCEAFTLMKAGLALHNLSRLKDAIEHYNIALKIFEDLRDDLGVSHTLTSIGWSYSGLGKFKESLDHCQRALEIRRRLGEPRAIAQTLNLVAAAHQELGDERQAIDSFLEAISLAKTAKDASIEAYALNGVASLYNQAGEFEKAIESVDQALPLWRSVGNIRGEAQSLHLRATSYSSRLYTSEAIESFEQALAIWRRVGNKFGEGQVLNNMALLYLHFEEFGRARGLLDQAFDIWKAIDNRVQQARTLDNLGLLEWRLGRLRESLEFFKKSLAISDSDGREIQKAAPLLNGGNVRALLGDTKQGLEDIRRALKISRDAGQRDLEHDALNDLGYFLSQQGDEEGALDCYRKAFLSTPARSNLARLEAKRGNLAVARTLIEEAIHRNETRRRHIPGQDLRISFGDRSRDAYEQHCEVLMQQYQESVKAGRPDEAVLTKAFKASEYARGRGLLEGLAESQADIRSSADPALIAEERRLEERLNARDTQRNRFLNVAGREDRLTAINNEIQELEWQLSDVRGRIRSRYPDYAALIEPQAPNLADIQKALDDDTVFLEYFLGREKSFLWLLTSNSIDCFELPDRPTIESKAGALYELLSDNSQEQAAGSVRYKAGAAYRETSAELARMLVGPVSSRLGTKRLVIVADGALQYIPFGALPVVSLNHKNKDAGTSLGAYRPLIVDHEIINAPSGAVLAALRSHSVDRPRPKKELAVFADAVFSKDDPRLSPAEAVQGTLPKITARTDALRDFEKIAGEAGLPGFVRLRFSRNEADAIASFLPATQKLEALDFAASKSTAQSDALKDYRILHFATHGLLNSLHPDLSGLVFSLVDQQGRSQDGFLRSYEIYNLKLNADLVVLSGCQTALGKYAKSEGLIGLTRGFMYAGVPRVVASLWRVDDRATAELMKRFYRGMLQEKRRPAAALRAAQVSMLSEPRWSSPHYWAPFTIQGEWK